MCDLHIEIRPAQFAYKYCPDRGQNLHFQNTNCSIENMIMANLSAFAFLLCLVVLGATRGALAEYESSWCDPQLCNAGAAHVACNNNGVSEDHASKDEPSLSV